MTSQVRIRHAAAHIQSGGVVACPAEAVWGLSCDPWSLAAVAQLCDMKQRPISKGVIVASGDVADFAPLLDGLTLDQRQAVLDSWPGPVTWLVPHRNFFPSSHRTLHGALLDSEILGDVYLAMTGGQVSLLLGGKDDINSGSHQQNSIRRIVMDTSGLPVIQADDIELAAHAERLAAIEKAADGKCLWLDT